MTHDEVIEILETERKNCEAIAEAKGGIVSEVHWRMADSMRIAVNVIERHQVKSALAEAERVTAEYQELIAAIESREVADGSVGY
jgi:DNA topoisomerase IA